MTITVQYLVGDSEPFDETLRAFIARQWNEDATDGIKPTFLSPQGIGKDKMNKLNSIQQGDIEVSKVEGLIMFETQSSDYVPTASGAGKSGKTFNDAILIQMYGASRYHLFLFMREFNRILSDFRPNTATRVKKSDGTDDSAIAYFDRDQVSWAKPLTVDDETHILTTTSLLGCRWHLIES